MTDFPKTLDAGRVIAHRGASRVAPENTLAAFRAAAAQGASWIEFDLSALGDGTPVVIHDQTLDRCTDATGALSDIGRGDLAHIHAGAGFGAEFADEPLPTLEAVLDLIEELGISANLEIKTNAEAPGHALGHLARAAADALASRPDLAGRIVTSSFDEEELRAFREIAPDAPVALLVDEPPDDWRARLAALRAEALHLHHEFLSQSLLSEAQGFDFRVRVFTVNNPALMVPFREFGLTGVITDHPPLFLDAPDWESWARR